MGNIRNPNRAALRFLGGTLEDCSGANFFELLKSSEGGNAQRISLLRTKVERCVPISQEEMSISTVKENIERFVLVSIYSLERSPSSYKHLVTLVDVSKERESERVKTDFLLLASHQLRTPLTTIKWYIDYLLTMDNTEDMPPIVHEYLEQIYIGNERMIELITTLLTVSRIEMGTLAPEYRSMHINKVIQDVLEELEKDIQKKQLVIKMRVEGNDELVMDKTMIRIIIHNLITNAIKYTPENGVITISSLFGAHSGLVSVKDTGHGIPEKEQEKIFSKMFRATNARKVSTNGTGLGLYLSKAFAQKLGGGIDFISKEEEGTTFTLSLPRVAPEA